MITGSTRVAGVVGGPDQVASSLSPRIHNAAFDALGLNWVYLPFPVKEGELEVALRGLQKAGIRGLNVTMPHKIAAAQAVDRVEGPASSTGAVNTIESRGTELIGHNTDGEGLVSFLRKDVGAEVAGVGVLVLGSGGAARAVVAALGAAGASSITVAARDLSRGEGLATLAGPASFEVVKFESIGEDRVASAGIIVNATPLGGRGEPIPLPTAAIAPEAVVVDLVYSPPSTPLLEEARRRGATAHNGLGMLLHQAALAFEIWTGVQPPLEKMSAAALAEVGMGRRQGAPLKQHAAGAD